MGGMGSGRRYQGGRSTTEDYRPLDVRKLHKAGLLAAGHVALWSWYSRGELRASIQVQAEDGRVRLIYAATENGERRNYSYLVRLDWTPCQYGGARPWFLCPADGCGRRVAILFGGAVFACRHCSTSRSGNGITTGWPGARTRSGGGWAGPWASSTRHHGRNRGGMHWRTFWRPTAEHNRLVGASLEGMSEHLGTVRRGLGRHAGGLTA